MNIFVKTLFLISVSAAAAVSSFAASPAQIEKLINSSDFNESASIAVSVRNMQNGNIIYGRNDKKLFIPASSLKLFTAYASLDTLGYDYEFKTQFYKSGGDLYIKLGADPLLTSGQLMSAFKELQNSGQTSFKNLYFDDSIIDKKEFAPSWMQEDDISPYTPKVSAYNLDGNVIEAVLSPSKDGMMSVSLKSKFPMSVISFIQSGSEDMLEMERRNWNNPDLTEVWGTVNKTKSFNIPISSMRRYFIFNTENALDEAKIKISASKYASKLVPENAELLAEISNPISNTIQPILKDSSNLMAETIYKLAASKKYNASGTDELAGGMFSSFYSKLGADTKNIIIKDGCGVSRKNLFTADWMTNALYKIYNTKDFENFKKNMAQAGDGTLAKRLYDLRGEAWLKTGSLENISAVTGFVKSKDGRVYAVSVLVQNFKENQSQIKQFEDEIIKIIYNK